MPPDARSIPIEEPQPRRPSLPAVWLASTERVAEADDPKARARLAVVLSEDEHRRLRALHSTRSRDLFLIAHYLKRRVLSIYSPDRHEVSWRFVSGSRGKPFIAPELDGGLQFNLSHAGTVAAVLVTSGQDCGVDVEHLRTDISCIDLARRFFHPAEARVVDARGSEAFHEYWTVKEAFIKLTGAGLSIPFDSFCVELEPRPRITLDGIGLDSIGPAAVEVFQRRLPGNYFLAAAIRGSAPIEPPAVRWLAELAPTDRG